MDYVSGAVAADYDDALDEHLPFKCSLRPFGRCIALTYVARLINKSYDVPLRVEKAPVLEQMSLA
jgi:hypothetical protein